VSITSKRTALGAGLALTAAGLGLVSASAARSALPTPTATLVAQAAGGNAPLDAVPDPTGQTIYFTTNGPAGPGVFGVPAVGGPVQTIAQGGALGNPVGLVVGPDGKRLYVADGGRILVVKVGGGGGVSVLAGSRGTHARGLEVQADGATQRIVFTGSDPANGKPGVFALGLHGATRPRVLAEGGRLRAPQGVAIARRGAIYVTDRGAGGLQDGRVLKLAYGRVAQIAGGIRLGDPAGVALVADGSRLLVSSLAASAGTAQVEIVNTSTLATGIFDDTIGANTGAGGLHRGLRTTVMAWADVSRSGRVYRVDP
jgi:DNA-binding beta-propeller fold protein YncE